MIPHGTSLNPSKTLRVSRPYRFCNLHRCSSRSQNWVILLFGSAGGRGSTLDTRINCSFAMCPILGVCASKLHDRYGFVELDTAFFSYMDLRGIEILAPSAT